MKTYSDWHVRIRRPDDNPKFIGPWASKGIARFEAVQHLMGQAEGPSHFLSGGEWYQLIPADSEDGQPYIETELVRQETKRKFIVSVWRGGSKFMGWDFEHPGQAATLFEALIAAHNATTPASVRSDYKETNPVSDSLLDALTDPYVTAKTYTWSTVFTDDIGFYLDMDVSKEWV